MTSELSPITQPQTLTINEEQIKQIIAPRYWLNMPRATERNKVIQATIENLDQDKIDILNNQIQQSLNDQSKLVYKTDRQTFVLDFEKNLYYGLKPNQLIIAKHNVFKSISIPVYSGKLNAIFSISQYLAFFNIQVGEKDFVHRFYHQDISTIPLIYSMDQKFHKAKLILAPNPYIDNSMLIGSPTL